MSASAAELRARLHAGQVLRSTFVKVDSPELVDLLATCGLDLVVVDLEHSQLDEAAARRLVRHAALVGLPAVVRLPEVDRGSVNRLLEAGAVGIQLSTLTSVEQSRALVAATRYAPEGARSVSLAQPAAAYGADGLVAHLRANAGAGAPLLVGQIETARTVDPMAELVAPLDVAFVGVTDLSVDLGVPGALDTAVFEARLDEIRDAVESHGGPPAGPVLGGWAASAPAAEPLLARGTRYLTIGSDLAVIAGAFRASFPVATSAGRVDTDPTSIENPK